MCGIVGIFSHEPVSFALHDSLVQLQHRGQDAAGVMTCDFDRFYRFIGKGLVRDIFSKDTLEPLLGSMGIGHVRYPTSGKNSREETQPFWLSSPFGIAIAHNGDLVNTAQLKDELKQKTHRHMNTDSDTEILLHVIASAFQRSLSHNDFNGDFFQVLCEVFSQVANHVRGSYSIVCLIVGKGLLAYRDPRGIRPLVHGTRAHADGHIDHIFASEATMFDSLHFTRPEPLEPGELMFVNTEGELFRKVVKQTSRSPCIFEYIYFARPDASLDHISVYQSRRRMGQALAKQWQEKFPHHKPDVVIPVPFSSNTSAIALAQALGIPYEEGLYKNPYIGRTFITPGDGHRKKCVQYKLHAEESVIAGRNILVVDDSIVRGTTSQEIISMIKKAGAKKIFFASTAPPVKFPCFYGINMPTSHELIAANQSLESIQETLGLDALLFQTQEDLIEAVVQTNPLAMTPCLACFNGHYIEGKP